MKVKELLDHLEKTREINEKIGFSAPEIYIRVDFQSYVITCKEDLVSELNYIFTFVCEKNDKVDEKELLESDIDEEGEFTYKGIQIRFRQHF